MLDLFLSCYSFTTKKKKKKNLKCSLSDHAYSACLTRTNDGRPSAYMLTAVSRPHPGNDCVINPEPFFKLLLTAEGENGTQTVSAHLSPKPRWGWFDPAWLSVIVKDRGWMERDRTRTQTRPLQMNWILSSVLVESCCLWLIFCYINKSHGCHQNASVLLRSITSVLWINHVSTSKINNKSNKNKAFPTCNE